ncbi:amidohydrolase family protein [Lentzea sp. BCCO 10_0856]|uniref:Amidohydrolase family protein n=1 Tax=Lentzea miocenica TaxID=3095431 RepID=A0ABU4T6A2_9PSEU|nr:amidohydrolase family protein [Lentzea sp. BCCO 10_0856]MDX8033681.1 amidohydrolase family protein [Lentzea sp. BCCO 10_0856]
MGILPFVAELGLIDHHCHGVLRTDSTREEFESLLLEADAVSPLGGSFFDSALGFAVRRWCAPLLDLPRHASAEAYLERRNSLHITEVSRTFLMASGIHTFLVDGGFQPDRLLSGAELGSLAGVVSHDVVRLEHLAEELRPSVSPSEFLDAVRSRLASSSAVGAKSVAAYRVGLDLPGARPVDSDVVLAVEAWSSGRLVSPVVITWLAWEALDAGLPLQFHVGYGDSDIDLHRCDPSLLTPFLRATASLGVPVLLLHNYPFHRQAGYLAQVFPHVFCDLGLATHGLGHQAPRVLAEALEIVPYGKFLFSSDAFGLPELYYLGALLFRRALSEFLSDGLRRDAFLEEDAHRIARLIASDNAARVYKL